MSGSDIKPFSSELIHEVPLSMQTIQNIHINLESAPQIKFLPHNFINMREFSLMN